VPLDTPREVITQLQDLGLQVQQYNANNQLDLMAQYARDTSNYANDNDN